MNKELKKKIDTVKRNHALKRRAWEALLNLDALATATGIKYYTLTTGLNTGRDFGEDVYATMEARIEQAERELQQAKATA